MVYHNTDLRIAFKNLLNTFSSFLTFICTCHCLPPVIQLSDTPFICISSPLFQLYPIWLSTYRKARPKLISKATTPFISFLKAHILISLTFPKDTALIHLDIKDNWIFSNRTNSRLTLCIAYIISTTELTPTILSPLPLSFYCCAKGSLKHNVMYSIVSYIWNIFSSIVPIGHA